MIIDDLDTFITIPVSNIPHYKSRINILQRGLNLTCGYNTRNKMRWIIISDLNNTPLLTQTFLKHKKICQFNFNANQQGLSFTVTLRPKSESKEIPEDYDYLNWADDFDLYFLGRLQTTEEKFSINRRMVYVGQ